MSEREQELEKAIAEVRAVKDGERYRLHERERIYEALDTIARNTAAPVKYLLPSESAYNDYIAIIRAALDAARAIE